MTYFKQKPFVDPRVGHERAHPLANPDDWAAWWTKLYMNEMDRLWKERGDADVG